MPGGRPVAGLFGGAALLAGLAVVGLAGDGSGLISPAAGATLAACGVLVASGVVLVRRLRRATDALERTTREVEQAGSRLKVLVEHVPAAVYIDMADPDVSDGGRLAYMSPQIIGILGYQPSELVDDPELWPSRIHPDDREAAIAAYAKHWQTGQPLQAEYRMLARD